MPHEALEIKLRFWISSFPLKMFVAFSDECYCFKLLIYPIFDECNNNLNWKFNLTQCTCNETLKVSNTVLICIKLKYQITRFTVITNWEVVEIINWGARMPQNTFGWLWFPIEDFCTPPSSRTGVWPVRIQINPSPLWLLSVK